MAQAALLVATREFMQWLTQINFDLSWLPKAQPDLMLPSTELWKQDAISKLRASHPPARRTATCTLGGAESDILPSSV